MKKISIFFIVFLFLAFLSAEEAPEESAMPQQQPEKTQEAALDTEGKECCCDAATYDNTDPKKFYIQPAIGVGTGLSMLRFNASLDADILVGHTKRVNYYIGLDIDARMSLFVGFEPRELAIQANAVFDFIQEGVPELMSASLWFSAGIDLMFIRHYEEEFLTDHFFEYCQAWGFGVDLVFRNYVILKLGLDGLIGYYPDLTIAVGYRF